MADAPKILDTDYLDEAYPKINQAIDNANEALNKNTETNLKVEEAVNSANKAKQLAEEPVTADKIQGHGVINIFDPTKVVSGYSISGWDSTNKHPSYTADIDAFATEKLTLPKEGFILIDFYTQHSPGNQLVMVADVNDNFVTNANNYTKTWLKNPTGYLLVLDVAALRLSNPNAHYFYTVMTYQEGNTNTPTLDKQFIYISNSNTLPTEFVPYNKASISWLNVTYENLNNDLKAKLDSLDAESPIRTNEAFRVINDSFDVIGDWNTNGNGTVAINNGLAINGNKQIRYPKFYDFNFYTMKTIITLNDPLSKCAIGLYNTSYFSALWGVGYVDFANKLIGFKESINDFVNIPTSTNDLSFNFQVEEGSKFMLEIVRFGHDIIFRLHDLFTGNYVETSASYKSHGYPGINLFSGNIVLNQFDYVLPCEENPFILFTGDSITEQVAASQTDKGYAYKLLNYFNHNGTIVAKAGCNSAYILETVLPNIYERGLKPKYVHVLIGTNDSDDIETWKTNITAIHDLIVSNGGKPIICVPPFGTADNNIVPFSMRDFIRSKGWLTVRYDIATSIDKLGETKDSSLFGTTDQLHPNDPGNQAMFEQGVKQLKYIIS